MIGKILGSRYELLEKVGTGGMAIVYKAKCHLLNRFVAVKMLRDEYKTDQDFLNKFKKEAQAAASLSHQNIVNIYDVGSYEDIPYIVMEYVPGETLKAYIDKYNGFLRNEEIANFAKQIALALEHAHSNQIIHRDIKPHNILVTPDGLLKVADFGIASAITESTTSYSSEAIGSIRYTSPEQARGRNVDERTDLYSLGVLMYEMATRKVPFEGDTAVEVALKHMKDDIPSPGMINSTFHKGLESIIVRSLLKNIDQRYQTARELIDDIDKVITNPRDNVPFYDFKEDGATQKIPSLDDFKIKKGENRTMKTKTRKKKKKQNINIIATIGVVVLAFLAAAVIFVFGKLEPKNIETNEYLEMINVVGSTVENAKSQLELEGYRVVLQPEENHNTVEAGAVFKQSPQSGTKVKPGSQVTLYPSAGAIKLYTPNLIQKVYDDVKVELTNSEFEIGDVDYENNDVPKGYILSQNPLPNTEVVEGQKIDIVVSLGPEFNKVIVPSLMTLTLEEAQMKVREIGLGVGEISYEAHEEVPKGAIISQGVLEGDEVDYDTLIDVVISLGNGEVDTEPGDETNEPGDEVEVTKRFSFDASDFIGQDIVLKVLYGKDGKAPVVYSGEHTITDENKFLVLPITGSGSGTLYLYVNNEFHKSSEVDFSN